MSVVLALIGAKALWLTYAWLASAILASFLSARKGYGEQVGLASGLLLSVVGVIVWLLWPAKPDSRWRVHGPLGRRRGGETVPEARARAARGQRSEERPGGDEVRRSD